MINAKKIFFFKGGVGKLLFFKRHSNLFFVLLDSKKKHIITLTAGSCKAGNTKKQKVSPLNMNVIVEKLKNLMLVYNLRSLHFYMRQKLLYYYRKLSKLLKFYKILLSNYTFILKKSHGIKRGRNPRRI